MAAKTMQLKILVDEEDHSKLVHLSKTTGHSMAQIIRDAITWRHRMQDLNQPTCANGAPCLVAGMHLSMARHATPITELRPGDEHRLVSPLPARAS